MCPMPPGRQPTHRGVAEVEGRMPATAGRELVMDDACARPGRHTPVRGLALPRGKGVLRFVRKAHEQERRD